MRERVWCDPDVADLTTLAFIGGLVVIPRDLTSSRCLRVGTDVELTDGHILVAARLHRCHPSGSWCSYLIRS